MELSDKDKERIEQEAFKRYPDGEDIDLNWHYRTVFVSSAEYATIYERQKQAELIDILKEWVVWHETGTWSTPVGPFERSKVALNGNP